MPSRCRSTMPSNFQKRADVGPSEIGRRQGLPSSAAVTAFSFVNARRPSSPDGVPWASVSDQFICLIKLPKRATLVYLDVTPLVAAKART